MWEVRPPDPVTKPTKPVRTFFRSKPDKKAEEKPKVAGSMLTERLPCLDAVQKGD